jgi:hypothetical protein
MVDQLVDLLRKNNISIISMERRKASLEEAFLAILDEPSAQT